MAMRGGTMGRRAAGVGAFIPFVGKPVVLLDAIHRGVSAVNMIE
jgi:hypothetical protein